MALLFIVNLFAITPKFNQKTENICPIAFEKISLFIQPLADASLFETPSLRNFNCSFGFSFSRDQTTQFGVTIRLLPHCFPTLPNISSSVLAKLLWFVCLVCYPEIELLPLYRQLLPFQYNKVTNKSFIITLTVRWE